MILSLCFPDALSFAVEDQAGQETREEIRDPLRVE
jgi:hypothetical protein